MFFDALGVSSRDVRRFAAACGVPAERLRYYEREATLPTGTDLERVCEAAGVTPTALMLRMGRPDRGLLAALADRADAVEAVLETATSRPRPYATDGPPVRVLETDLGVLYRGDALRLLEATESESVDLVFADPPFNLDKAYPSEMDDDLEDRAYLDWCAAWLEACARVLKPGGSLFLWTLPKWAVRLAPGLEARLTFRHWIATSLTYSLPIRGRLYPAHYALLYYVRGAAPATFHPDRLPMETCPHCHGDLRDYGGYKHKMNPAGVSLPDVWTDIAPVRHARHKRRAGANELPVKLVDRVLRMASDPGDLVLDPFGGAGTTYAVAEMTGRRWLGVELGPTDGIVDRLSDLEDERAGLEALRAACNCLFTPETKAAREELGLWTDETVRAPGGSRRGRGARDAAAPTEGRVRQAEPPR